MYPQKVVVLLETPPFTGVCQETEKTETDITGLAPFSRGLLTFWISAMVGGRIIPVLPGPAKVFLGPCREFYIFLDSRSSSSVGSDRIF